MTHERIPCRHPGHLGSMVDDDSYYSCPDCLGGVHGGQGRSHRDVLDSTRAIMLFVLAALVCLVAMAVL